MTENPSPFGRLFAADDRAVSEVIGAILVFGLLIALLALVQTQAVPATNEKVEFDHSQAVQTDMAELQEAISLTAVQGRSQSPSIKLGLSYPSRLLFYNPSPVYGQLRTTAPGTVTLANVDASGDVNLLYTGGTYTYTTRPIEYRAGYHRYAEEPTIVREVGTLYEKYPEGTRVQGGSFVNGKQITLVTVNGSLQKNSLSTASVETVPLSAPARTVAVTNETGEQFSITVPTQLDNSTWADVLSPQYRSNGGYIVEQSYAAPSGSPYNFLTVTFEQGVTYELRMAQVGVGSKLDEPEPAYLTAISGDNESVLDNGVLKVTVEVRDRFNNPVAGETVNLSIVGGTTNGTFLANDEPRRTIKTGADGRATATFVPQNVDNARHVDIRASSQVNPPIPWSASFDLTNRNNTKLDVKIVNTGGPIGEPPLDPPNEFTLTDVSDQNTSILGQPILLGDAAYRVDWAVEDSPIDNHKNSELDTVEIRLVHSNSRRIVDAAKYEVNGETASGQIVLTHPDGSGKEYFVQLIYSDEGGYVLEKRLPVSDSDIADGSGCWVYPGSTGSC